LTFKNQFLCPRQLLATTAFDNDSLLSLSVLKQLLGKLPILLQDSLDLLLVLLQLVALLLQFLKKGRKDWQKRQFALPPG
jgi:hypothetical protein